MESSQWLKLLFLLVFSAWCPWPESNQHSLRNSILSRARLPVPPQGPPDTGQGGRRRSRRNIAGSLPRSTRADVIVACLDSAAGTGYDAGEVLFSGGHRDTCQRQPV